MSRADMKRDLTRILYERMAQEYEGFLEKISMQDPEDMIKASYEKVFKEDILAVVEGGGLDLRYVKALLRENHPLESCYKRWVEKESTYMDELKGCIEDHAKDLIKRRDKEFQR